MEHKVPCSTQRDLIVRLASPSEYITLIRRSGSSTLPFSILPSPSFRLGCLAYSAPMKFVALTVASVGVAALPQTLTLPLYKPCGSDTNNCCKFAGGRFQDCSIYAQSVTNFSGFLQACAASLKIPACCGQKQPGNLLEGFFNEVLGTSLGEAQCYLPASVAQT
ncbi:hypothetical protein J3459_017634 [Metarhizium acridum]|nr:hypothetical protein J3459_017634 [Metarhizium acridum]